MKLFSFITTSLLGFSSITTTLAAPSFTASNLYYAAGLKDEQTEKLLKGLQSAGIKVLRVWLDGQSGQPKGTPIVAYKPLEGHSPQSWDDTVLRRLDAFMVKAKAHDIKLLISLHSYNALEGEKDFYGQKWGTGNFYKNSEAKEHFKKRIEHVLTHKNAITGKTWAQSSDYIFAFETQNEAMHGNNDPASLVKWQCEMGAAIKSHLNSKGDILVSTGGGSYLATSLLDGYFTCSSLDVLAIHAYGDGDFKPAALSKYVEKAKAHSKMLIMQEWGACYTNTGNSACTYGNSIGASKRDNNIRTWAGNLDTAGIPWFYWQIIPNKDPHQDWDYEVGIDDDNWPALKQACLKAAQAESAFDFTRWLPSIGGRNSTTEPPNSTADHPPPQHGC